MGTFQAGEEITLPPITLDAGNIENVSAYAAIRNKVVCIDDVYTNDQFNFSGPKKYDEITGYRTKSMLALPLALPKGDDSDQQEVLGVIQLINATNQDTGEVINYGNICVILINRNIRHAKMRECDITDEPVSYTLNKDPIRAMIFYHGVIGTYAWVRDNAQVFNAYIHNAVSFIQ